MLGVFGMTTPWVGVKGGGNGGGARAEGIAWPEPATGLKGSGAGAGGTDAMPAAGDIGDAGLLRSIGWAPRAWSGGAIAGSNGAAS